MADHHPLHQVLMTAHAAHQERFVSKPPQPPLLPQAVWINPPTKESTTQNGVGTTTAPGADPRVVLNHEGSGVVAESVAVSPDAITVSTDKGLHYMPSASVLNSLPRSSSTSAQRVANALDSCFDACRDVADTAFGV